MKEEFIEKGKWNDGDINPKNPNLVWVSSANKGKGDWRTVKKNKIPKSAPAAKGVPSASTTSQAPAAPASKTNDDTAPDTTAAKKYDAPKPKITYTTKKPADGIVFEVPEEWRGKDQSGQTKVYHRDTFRKLYADKTKVDDDKLIRILNNKNGKREIRQLAYEEAMARGIPEDKIDVSGTLETTWNNIKIKIEILSPKKKTQVSDEEMEDYDDSVLGNLDPDKFLEENFDGGRDDGWKNPNNPIIQKQFDKLQTLASRRQYDAMVDYLKRKDPLYETPEEVMQGLNQTMFDFMSSSTGSPILVSAGGAGAGKTFGFNSVADFMELKRFDSKANQTGDGDYDYVIMPNDIEDEKDLMTTLAKHNGKIIVFDDKDKALVSSANKIISTMKAIADGDPKMRVFINPETKEQELFKGKLLFLTNKSLDTLNSDEDHKAIMSRARVEDVHFTVNENLELLKKRYKTMGANMSAVDAAEEKKIREALYQMIVSNADRLDPQRFTVRKFTKMLEAVNKTIKANKEKEKNDAAASIFGSKQKDWKRVAMQELTKAEDDTIDIEKAKKDFNMDEKAAAKIRKMYKKNPELCVELFGQEFCDAALGKKGSKKEEEVESDEDVTKAFMEDLSGMTLSEAEDLLFN